MKQFLIKEICANISGYVKEAHYETYVSAENKEEALKKYHEDTEYFGLPFGGGDN